MPGFTTHYLFGQNTYQKLNNNSLKRVIQRNHTVFSLGLQGPDIFFYYPLEYLPGKPHLGSLAHTSCTGRFLRNLIKSCDLFSSLEEKSIAAAYILGFLGHYTLDCKCHPFVYGRTDYRPDDPAYYGRHIRLETDIDTCLLYFYQHRLPSELHQDAVISLSPVQLEVVSSLLEYTYSNTYPDASVSAHKLSNAIRSMQWGTKALYDPTGRKKKLIRRLESVFPGYPVLSPLVPSDTLVFFLDPLNTQHRGWRNPWDPKHVSHESFFDLFESAQTSYLSMLICASCYYKAKGNVERSALLHDLLSSLGHNCYHSGLPIDDTTSFT